MMKKVKVLIKATLLCIVMLFCMESIQSVEVKAAAEDFTIWADDREEDNPYITIYIQGVEKLNSNYTAEVVTYTDEDGEKYFEPTVKKVSNDLYKCKIKLETEGKYLIYVSLYDIYDDSAAIYSNEIKLKYITTHKPKFEDSIDVMGQSKYIDFSDSNHVKKEGNTYYYKGLTAFFDVVVSIERDSISQLSCQVGGQSVSGKVKNYGDDGYITNYYGRRVTINGETDGQVVLKATSSSGETTTKSTGYKVVIDNTKPVAKFDGKFASKKTVYSNKAISVPIEVTESHFDSDKTRVMVNGREVSVSWHSSGSQNTADVKLSDGVNEISIVAYDKSGNVSDEVKSTKIIVDTKAPTVKVSGVANGNSYGNTNGSYTPYIIKVNLSDKYLSIAKGQLYRIDLKSKKVLEKIKLSANRGQKDWQLSCTDIKTDGYYKLVITVKDKADNTVTNKSLNKKGNFKVKDGKVVGNFYINRNGSLYEIDKASQKYFEKANNNIEDIVLYEYNINKIKKQDQHVTLITTYGEILLTVDKDYTWADVSKTMSNSKYQYVYKYTIKKEVFNQGMYSIKIVSAADVLGDGNNSLKIKASNGNIMNKVINIDKEAPEIISFEREGDLIFIHVRDNNLNVNSVKLSIGGKEQNITLDEDNSTSTNYCFTTEVSGTVTNVKLECIDNAGNTSSVDQFEKNIEDNSLVVMIVLISVLALAFVIAAIVIIVLVKKKK